MIYYNRNGEKKEFNKSKMKYIGHGECAEVFYYEDKIFKEYNSTTHQNDRLKEPEFDILKDIEHPQFMKIQDIYSKQNPLEQQKEAPFKIDVYCAKYYEPEDINILYKNINYLLDNCKGFETLFAIFIDNKIVGYDMKMKNIIVNKDGMIIIDLDLFQIKEWPKKKLKVEYKRKMLALLKSILNSYIAKEAERDKMTAKLEKELLKIDIDETTNVTYEISKKLGYVKRPIDYFRK